MKCNIICKLSTFSSILLSSVDAFLAARGRWSEDPEPDPGLAGSTGNITFMFLCSICPNRCGYAVYIINGDILHIETVYILLYLLSYSLLHDHLSIYVYIKTVEHLKLCSFKE